MENKNKSNQTKKSLLIYFPDLFGGGAQKQMRMLSEVLCANPYNVSVTIITHKEMSPENQVVADIYKKNHSEFNWLIFPNIADKINHNIPYSWINIFKNILRLKSFTRGKRYSAVLCFFHRGLGLLFFARIKCDRFIFSERGKTDPNGRIFRYGKFILNKINAFVANSEYSQRILSGMGFKTHYIKNAVNTNLKFKMLPTNEIAKLLNAGWYCARKNQLPLIMALSLLHNEGYTFHAKFFGGIDIENKEYKGLCEAAVVEYGLRNSVVINGIIDSNEMFNEYQNTDLVILASLSEGTPNVVLEAFAYGRLVVASDIEQHRIIFSDKRFLFNPNDPESIKETIKMALSLSEVEKLKVIEKNYKYVCVSYSSKIMVKEFSEVLFSEV